MATTQAIQEFAQVLSQQTGMDPTAALEWAQEENGPGNNILGVMGKSGPVSYPSVQMAAESVANMLNSSMYSGIKQAIQSGGDTQAQLQAIINSPWNTGKADDPNAYADTGFRTQAGMSPGGSGPAADSATSPLTDTSAEAAAVAAANAAGDSGTNAQLQALQAQITQLTAQQTATTQQNQADAFATLSADLGQYGLSGLAPWLQGEIQAAKPNDQILLDLQQTPQFQQRFPAMAALQQAGLPAIDPSTYLSTETAYKQALQQAGISPATLTPQDFVGLFTNQVDPTEMTQRLNDYHTIATTYAPAMQQAFLEQIGEPISESDVYKMFNGMAPQQVLAYTQRTGTPVPTASDFTDALNTNSQNNTGELSTAQLETQMQRVTAANTAQFNNPGSGPSTQQQAANLTQPLTQTY